MGKPIDKRVDVWAFGVVLFEMLTGRRAFDGENASGIVAAVLKDTPSWALLPAETPWSIRRLLHRCLEKDRRERLGDMSAVRLDIKDALAGEPTSAGAKLPNTRGPGHRLAWAAALLTMTVLSGLLAILYFRTPPELPEMRLPIDTPSTTEAFSFALSPDRRRLAFVADDAGESRLWVRPLEAVRAVPLAGTEGATYPFWSPDSRSIAFFASGWLKRLDIGSGSPRPLTRVIAPRGGSWSREGVILFAPTILDPLWQCPDSGGTPARVTRLDALGQGGHLFPQFLPDGRRFLFYVHGNVDVQGIYLGSLGSEKTTRLAAAETAGAYLASGWLLFVRDGVLVARRFDSSRGELSGDPVTVADPVGFDPVQHTGAFSTAAGVVVYRASVGLEKRQLTWFDRSGTPQARWARRTTPPGMARTLTGWAAGRGRASGPREPRRLGFRRRATLASDVRWEQRYRCDLVARWQLDRVQLEPEGSFQPVPETVERCGQRGAHPRVCVAQRRQRLVARRPSPVFRQRSEDEL